MTQSKDSTVFVSDPFARRLMVRYLNQRHDDIDTLRAALAEGDFGRIRKKGHNLFGSGSAYGLDRVSELGAGLEKEAERGNSAAIGDLIDRLDAYINNVRIV